MSSYYWKHREERRKKNKEYYQKKSKQIRTKVNQYRKENIDEIKKKKINYYRTMNGFLTHRYASMKQRNVVSFSKEELSKWLDCRKRLFEKLLIEWKKNGFKREFSPSINRIDDFKGYSIDNIELITWKKNNELGINSIKTKKQKERPVTLHKGNENVDFNSIKDACKFLNVTHQSVCKVVNGKYKTCKGYKITSKKPNRRSGEK